jgi:ABC-type branched-subunit amino acid transport system substrate-binding protein
VGDTWRIGILFSRTGVTDVTETEHFRGTALAIEEINLSGGVLGRPIDPVCYDPGSRPETYREQAERLLTTDGISTIFGCSTSDCRKAILTAIERRNGLLFYPSLYEGFEYSPNVIYGGATPNQNSIQLARYIAENHGKRIFLVGSDYIYPRESNRIMREFIEREGGEIVAEHYVPTRMPDARQLERICQEIARSRPDAVFSTVVGAGCRMFYRIYRDAGIDPNTIPIGSLTMAEGEIRAIGPEYCVGHITSASYFSSIDSPENRQFTLAYRARYGSDAPVSLYAEASYTQIHVFARALERAGSLDPERLTAAAAGLEFEAPQGRITIEPDNQHTTLRPRIGVVEESGAFRIVWEAQTPVRPDPYLVNLAYDDAWLDERAPS